jgi:hypothetical protein
MDDHYHLHQAVNSTACIQHGTRYKSLVVYENLYHPSARYIISTKHTTELRKCDNFKHWAWLDAEKDVDFSSCTLQDYKPARHGVSSTAK